MTLYAEWIHEVNNVGANRSLVTRYMIQGVANIGIRDQPFNLGEGAIYLCPLTKNVSHETNIIGSVLHEKAVFFFKFTPSPSDKTELVYPKFSYCKKHVQKI